MGPGSEKTRCASTIGDRPDRNIRSPSAVRRARLGRNPHGLANAMILPHAIRYNAEAVPWAIAGLALSMGVSDPADAVADLVARLGLPSGLRECGVTEEDLDAVAQTAPSNGNVANNPRPVSEEDARAILAAAY